MHNDIWLFVDNYMYLVKLLNGKYEFDNVDNGNGDDDDDNDDASTLSYYQDGDGRLILLLAMPRVV